MRTPQPRSRGTVTAPATPNPPSSSTPARSWAVRGSRPSSSGAVPSSTTPPRVFGPCASDDSPRTSVTRSTASAGITETSARPSQANVSGTPSSRTATCRDSEPRMVTSASPREFVRTWAPGRARSTCSTVGADPSGSESKSAVTAPAPPGIAVGREPRTRTSGNSTSIVSAGGDGGCAAASAAAAPRASIASSHRTRRSTCRASCAGVTAPHALRACGRPCTIVERSAGSVAVGGRADRFPASGAGAASVRRGRGWPSSTRSGSGHPKQGGSPIRHRPRWGQPAGAARCTSCPG